MGNGGTGERGNGTLLVKIEECGSILQEKSKISPSLAKTFIKRIHISFVRIWGWLRLFVRRAGTVCGMSVLSGRKNEE